MQNVYFYRHLNHSIMAQNDIVTGAGNQPDYSQKFTIFTDGSALNNKASAPAGSAVYIPSMKRLWSKSMLATNNQAELEAIRYALWWFKENAQQIGNIPDNTLYLFTDSAYSMNAISGKWKKLKENPWLGLIVEANKSIFVLAVSWLIFFLALMFLAYILF